MGLLRKVMVLEFELGHKFGWDVVKSIYPKLRYILFLMTFCLAIGLLHSYKSQH